MVTSNQRVKARLCELYDELIVHDGFATFAVEIRILRRGQKEVIVHCGKQYRFVVDVPAAAPGRDRPATPATGLSRGNEPV